MIPITSILYFLNNIDSFFKLPFCSSYGILDWLYSNGFGKLPITYIVIDDEPNTLEYFSKEGTLIQTSSIPANEMIKGNWDENTGLKRKHVKQAIKILNKSMS